MSETIQEPVTEQTSNSNESEASVDKEIETPVAISESKTKNEMQSEISNDLEIDYLSSDLFSNIKQISAEDLSQNKEEDEIPQEEQDRYKSTLTDITEKEIITGRIIGINEKDVLIDIGFKSEGIIDRNEFSENDIPEVGEKIEVFLEKIEDESGKTILSKEKADFLSRWKELREVFDNEKILNFEQIDKLLEISKMRNNELSRILRKIFDYDNLAILANELKFKETVEFQNSRQITKFDLIKEYAEPKELSKINSQKLDSSMKSNFEINQIFQTNSEKMSNMRYNENLEKLQCL